MSYEVSNAAFLGIPVRDVAEAIIPATEVSLWDDGVYVLADDKFAELSKSAATFANDWSCPSMEVMTKSGFVESGGSADLTGPRAFVARLLLTAAGIVSTEFYGQWSGLPGDLVFTIRIFPTALKGVSVKGKPTSHTLIYLENGVLAHLAKGLAKQQRLNTFTTEQVKVECLKMVLNELLDMRKSANQETERNVAQGIEGWMSVFIGKYLESRECPWNVVQIGSTACGDVIEDGGMEENTPYVIYGGMQWYDEEGWDDPREDDLEGVELVRDVLLGEDNTTDWGKFTPQFGG